MKIKTIQNIKATILGLIIAISAGYAVAAVNTGVFTPPECSPPGCNTPAPINVGPLGQYKEGGLTVGDTDMSKLDSAVKFAVPKGTSFFLNMLSDGAVVTRSLNFLSPGATPSLSLLNSVTVKSDKDQNISFFDMKLNRNVFSVDNGTVVINDGGTSLINKVLVSSDANGRAIWRNLNDIPPCSTCGGASGGAPKIVRFIPAKSAVLQGYMDRFANVQMSEGVFISSDLDTMNKICSLVFSDTRYYFNHTSQVALVNPLPYSKQYKWDGSQFNLIATSYPAYQYLVNPNKAFSCSNIPITDQL